MDRKEKLFKNTIAYTIGNFGTKILAYVLVLVYTHFIPSKELGYYDLIITTVSLFTPIILLMFDDGVYRWLIDANEKDKGLIIATCLRTITSMTIFSIAVLLLVNNFYPIKYIASIIVFLSSSMIYNLFLNSVRGLGNSFLYATSGIVNSVTLLVLELIGLTVFDLGVEALLVSKGISNVITIVFIYFKQKEFKGVLKSPFNKTLAKDILKYSAPLIPNNICWWIVNSSDRYIILFFLGASFNGIYSISNKFPTIVTTISSIFYFSFQEAMIKEFDAQDRDEFYSNIFKKYYILLFSLIICGIPATKIVVELFTGVEYHSAWMYSGFLYLSTVYSALSGLLGIGYQISKETKRSVLSTVGASFINIFINICAISFLGLHAASLSTFIAYFYLLIIRLKHTKKYFKLKIEWRQFILLNLLSLVMIVITYITSIHVCIALTVLAVFMLVYLNKEIVLSIIDKVLRKRR